MFQSLQKALESEVAACIMTKILGVVLCCHV